MSRIDKINELLRGELANLINGYLELENGLVTIIYVKSSADLRTAKVGVSVLPENLTGTALKKLRKNNRLFSQSLKKKLNLKNIPRFFWEVDANERYALNIEKTIKKITEKKDNKHRQ